MRSLLTPVFLFGLFFTAAADAVEYPRSLSIEGHTLRVHHPVIDRWDDFRAVEGWIPVEVRLAGDERQWVGAVRARAATRLDRANGLVTLGDTEVLGVNFHDGDAPQRVRDLASLAVGSEAREVSLDVLLSALAEGFEVPSQGRAVPKLDYSPPRIVVTERPSRLLLIDKEPVLAAINGTRLKVVVNTDWQLFHDTESKEWYVLNDGVWQRNALLASGDWTTTDALPDDFRQLAISARWPRVTEAYPPVVPARAPARIIVSLEPAELVSMDGAPRLRAVGNQGLEQVTNTAAPLFRLEARWFFLAAGRWFEARELDGPWTAVDSLPAAFGGIPEDDIAAGVRRAVPGTMEATMALLEASLPYENRVTDSVADALQVAYAGRPQFVSITGTRLARAVNSPFTIIRHNNFYYLCHDAAWFLSASPTGPWQLARDVPQAIYDIPASDPAHHVTYVFVEPPAQASQDEVVFTYNNGYLGDFSDGKVVVQGTGWYYDPWLWNSPAGHPVYWAYPMTYGWRFPGTARYAHPFSYYGGYFSRQTLELTSETYGPGDEADPRFQDPRLARRGVDYTTLTEQRAQESLQQFNAADDLYTDTEGNVYRRSDDGWAQARDGGWSTMAELERQYGMAPGSGLGEAYVAPSGRSAYRQNERDIERMERYYRNRQRAYNMHSAIYVGR